MNLDELRSAQAKERRKDSLQHLRDSFYDDVAAYVADLRAARDRRAEQVDKPFSDDDVRRLSDEVETAEEVAEALYERRVGKVVKLASFAAAEMSVDADGMTSEERKLFDDLVDRIKRNKSNVLDVLSGEVSVDGAASESAPVPGADSPSESTTDGIAEGEEPAERGEPTEGVAADSREDPVPPAPEPGPSNETSAAEGGDDGVADALAGAMGGADDEVADALDAARDGASEGADSLPPTDASGREAGEGTADGTPGGATTDGGPTAVPPEPAPPGAPGVDDSETASDTDRVGDATGGTGVSAETDTGSDTEPDAGIDDRATVRITRDVGAIFGVDEREYDLASEDVVTLPVENAEPLVERDAAERLD